LDDPIDEFDRSISKLREHRIVRDRDDRDVVLGLDPFEFGEYRSAGLLVEISSRFVCEDDVGLVNQRAGDRDALSLTARELGWPVFQPVSQSEPGE
jgi:hypothetical protein